MAAPFRFLHAADFFLGQPLVGSGSLHAAIRETCRDAPYAAARRVFDVALQYRVAFVILTGELWSAEGGPQATEFLREQFERLRAHDIPVYWASGRSVSGDEAAPVTVPSNVHHFRSDSTERILIRRGRKALALLHGKSWARECPALEIDNAEPGLFAAAVTCGSRLPAGWNRDDVNYWAMGGTGRRRTRRAGLRLVHAPGRPQGMSIDETGPRGCSLVQVNRSGNAKIRPIATHAVRWRRARIKLEEDIAVEQLVERMVEGTRQSKSTGDGKVSNRADEHSQRDDMPLDLIVWSIEADGTMGARLRHGQLIEEVLAKYREQVQHHGLNVATAGIDVAFREFRREWLEEDSLLSEFLDVVRHARSDASHADLSEFLPIEPADPELDQAIGLVDRQHYADLLRDAAALGVDLLTGDVDVDEFVAAWGKS